MGGGLILWKQGAPMHLPHLNIFKPLYLVKTGSVASTFLKLAATTGRFVPFDSDASALMGLLLKQNGLEAINTRHGDVLPRGRSIAHVKKHQSPGCPSIHRMVLRVYQGFVPFQKLKIQ
jgi:hypothetical protein